MARKVLPIAILTLSTVSLPALIFPELFFALARLDAGSLVGMRL